MEHIDSFVTHVDAPGIILDGGHGIIIRARNIEVVDGRRGNGGHSGNIGFGRRTRDVAGDAGNGRG